MYASLNEEMVAAVPALDEAYRAEVAWWKGEKPPCHVVFGNVLNPYISDRLAADDPDAVAIVFRFLELMAADSDERVRDVLRDTVLEHIRDESDIHRNRATRAMGPATFAHWQQIAGDE